VMNDGYYNTRDQDGNGVIDAEQDYPIPVVDGLPPGCWPVEPGTPGFDTFPFACITPLETAVGECSDSFPCFCNTETAVDCDLSPSDDPAFEHSMQLDANLQLYWTIETEGEAEASFYPAMRAMLVKQGDGWAALATSLDTLMAGSEAVIGQGGNAPEKYDLVGRVFPVRAAESNQTLRNAQTDLENGNLVLRWTKSLVEDADSIDITAEPGVAQQFLYAYLDTPALEYHTFSNRGAAQVVLDPVCDPNATPPPTQSPTPTFVASGCDSDDPDFDFALALDSSLTFSWRVSGDVLVAKLTRAGGGWAGFAASLDAFMPNSDAVIGTDEALAEKYFMEDTVRPSTSGVAQTLTDVRTEVLANGDVEYRYTKILAEPGEIEILGEGMNSFVWAHGSGSLSFHLNTRGALNLDLSNCAFVELDLQPVRSQAVKIHGMLMVAAWAYCAPLGIFFARCKRAFLHHGLFKTWLTLHAAVQLAALVCTAIGFAHIYDAIKDSDVRDHLTFRHPKLGVGVMIGGVTQLLMGVVRPHPPHHGEAKAIARYAFEFAHRLVGYGTLVLGLLTMLAGANKALELQHVDQVFTWNAAIIAPIAVTGGLGILVTIYIFTLGSTSSPAAAGKGVEMTSKSGDSEALDEADTGV